MPRRLQRPGITAGTQAKSYTHALLICACRQPLQGMTGKAASQTVPPLVIKTCPVKMPLARRLYEGLTQHMDQKDCNSRLLWSKRFRVVYRCHDFTRDNTFN